MGLSGTINSRISKFETEYGSWIGLQDRQNEKLRNALQTNASDIQQLHLLVESSLNQYSNLFRMKAEAAKVDVFYLISGAWKAPVERLFLWIGGYRPSQLLNIIVPKLDALTDQQIVTINNLCLSTLQSEDALSQGLEKLQQRMIKDIQFQTDPVDSRYYGFHTAAAIDKGEVVESFVNQADHLRHQTLLYMSRILTIGQVAQGLLAMGEYFQRLRALSSLWTARSSTQHSSNTLFEIEYGSWVEEQDRKNKELRNTLQSNASNTQIHQLVESSLNQYSNLFKMNAEAAKTDVFYLISGEWKTSVECLFHWIGGFLPSQLLNIILPKLDSLTDQQIVSINNRRLSCQQAEDALSVGLEKLQQSIINNIQAEDPLDFGNSGFQMAAAIDKLEALECFVIQADNLRQETLMYISHILTIGQTAESLSAMGEYFHLLHNQRTHLMARI